MTDVKQILELWFKLRETPKEYLPIVKFSNNNPWSYEIRRDMEEAFKLDPEGLTALLILDNFRTDFFSSCGISISDILLNKNFETFISDCRRLTEMLSEEDIVNALEEFIGNVCHAVEHIGIDRKDVTDMINDRYEMSVLRRDSLRSMDTLTLHQFFQGDTKTDHLAFLPDIHLFWNMNSLIHCAWQSADGVSINLIKDPMATSSYFAFVAKNGGNLTVLTDKPEEANPLSKYMSRRPEKDFTRRVFRNHFPYGLLDLTVDHKGYLHPGRYSLVPLQDKPIKVGSLSTLEPDEIIWTVMMFSLLDSKLYKENYHCAELSYTSDMIEDPGISSALIEGNRSCALMVKDYKPLIAPTLKLEDLENDPQYVSSCGIHSWLYKRYKDQIPNDILNGLRPNDDTTLFLLSDNTTFNAPKERIRQTCTWNLSVDPVLLKDPKDLDWHVGENGTRFRYGSSDTIDDAIVLKKMTGDEFGSKDSLMSDYRWFARYNAAKFIRRKAEEEFNKRENEVTSWVRERIEPNLERICSDIIYHISVKEKEKHPCSFSITPMKGEWWREVSTEHVAFTFAKDRKAYLRRPGTYHYPLYNKADAGCWFAEDAPCNYILKVRAYNVNDLLYLTGCSSPDELPDVLRFWKDTGHIDNYLLRRVDPMDWVIRNPWNDLSFDIIIGIGKKHLTKVKKDLGLK